MNVTEVLNGSLGLPTSASPGGGDDWSASDVLDLSSDTTLQNFIEFQIANGIDYYFSPVCSAVGILGNMWAFAILLTPSMRKSTTCQYMAALAIADSLILVYNVLFLIRKFPGLDFFNPWTCKLMFFAFYYTIHFDVGVMMAMTIEKYLAVKFPLQAASWKPRTKLIIGLIALACLVLDFHSLITRGMVVDPNTGVEGCLPTSPTNRFFLFMVWPWIDAVVYCFLPLSTLFILNILIIYTVKKSRKMRQRMMENPESNSAANNGASADTSKTSKENQITRMLLLVSFAFLLLVGPMAIIIIVERRFDLSTTPHQAAIYHLARTIMNNLMYTNHSLNFLLYCLSAKRFREALLDTLCFFRKGKGHRNNGPVQATRATKTTVATPTESNTHM